MNPVTLWRWSRTAYLRKIPLVPRLLKTVIFLVYHAILPGEAVVGCDLMLDHYGLGVVIHPNVTIGDRVRIYHGVTLAAETWVGSEHRIFVGDDVMIGAGQLLSPAPTPACTLETGLGSVPGPSSPKMSRPASLSSVRRHARSISALMKTGWNGHNNARGGAANTD